MIKEESFHYQCHFRLFSHKWIYRLSLLPLIYLLISPKIRVVRICTCMVLKYFPLTPQNMVQKSYKFAAGWKNWARWLRVRDTNISIPFGGFSFGMSAGCCLYSVYKDRPHTKICSYEFYICDVVSKNPDDTIPLYRDELTCAAAIRDMWENCPRTGIWFCWIRNI